MGPLSTIKTFAPTALLLLCWLLIAGCAQADIVRGKVVAIADGDSLTLLVGQRRVKVRLSGIDAPERGQPHNKASKQSLATLLFGKNVTVESHKQDRYGRLLGTIQMEGRDVGLVQIERGYAWWYQRYAKDQRPADAHGYERAEQAARAARRGLWQEPNPTPPWEWRRR